MNDMYDEGAEPVNKTAANVIFSDKEISTLSPKTSTIRWESPPDTILTPRYINDLTGIVYGRLKVIGLLPKMIKNKRHWLVRCSCGWYEVRVEKTLKKRRDPDDCCQECRNVKFIKRHHEYISHLERTGRELRQGDS